ncbi:MAG: metal ABC transporter permease, partial [Symploca sp. SIO2C1]|nr:metal ABC transporter permease [Symploca sp. SIO2C1]
YLLVKELHQMMGLGAAISMISGVSGMYLSYYFDLLSGPAIVLIIFGFFFLALLFSPTQGILTQPEILRWTIRRWHQLKQFKR